MGALPLQVGIGTGENIGFLHRANSWRPGRLSASDFLPSRWGFSTIKTQSTAASELHFRYQAVRDLTESLAAPLTAEDQSIQSMPEASPTKWHRAHTTWFFESFLLQPHLRDYHLFHPKFGYLFNSYYQALGTRHPRPERGLISRPGVAEIGDYRRYVDAAMELLLQQNPSDEVAALVELGINHEQQHQELLLMDIKHVLWQNPLRPAYADLPDRDARPAPPLKWIEHQGGLIEQGHSGSGFGYDNEFPRHKVWCEPFALASRPVTNGEWRAFIADGGYERPELWLSAGWDTVCQRDLQAPLYWSLRQEEIFTLGGPQRLDWDSSVCHVSYYEADAFATWAGARLPTESEWESIASEVPLAGAFLDQKVLQPSAEPNGDGVQQMYGDVWEWSSSAYLPYPGYRAPEGAVGEYNGKFMVNQHVLRGGSCATPHGHLRASYRNFFPPDARWVFSGVRLARSL